MDTVLCNEELSLSVRPSRPYASKCHQEQTGEPRSANFCIAMYINEESAHAIFSNFVNDHDLHFQGKKF